MKSNYEIKEIERRKGREKTYSLELRIDFNNKKDKDEFLRMVKDFLR